MLARAMRRLMSYLLWPALMLATVATVALGSTIEQQKRRFLLAYAALIVALAVLERVMPHERAWWKSDGQTLADLGHTAMLKGASFVISFVIVIEGSAAAGAPSGPFWPSAWPIALQVALALVIAEIGLYAPHRLAHEWRRLWHFHAGHHSVTRLWFVNTGRFHFGDSIVSVALTQPLLWLSGAPRPPTSASTKRCRLDFWLSWPTRFAPSGRRLSRP